MAAIELEIDASTQHAVAYRDGKPVATVQRRRVYTNGPVWRAFDLTGAELFNTISNVSAAYLAKRIERALARREAMAALKTAELELSGLAYSAALPMVRAEIAKAEPVAAAQPVQVLPEPYRTQREANGKWSAYYGGGYMCGGFASEAAAATWIREFVAI
ncbi:MAG: hypothetical protein E5V40_04315 [Mesorhizobium sp.]|nr:MAG: hypothetical protein E5V40_04315 [Mesorhizobium sp.]